MRSLFSCLGIVPGIFLITQAVAAPIEPPLPPGLIAAPMTNRSITTARPMGQVIARMSSATKTNHPLVWDSMVKEQRAEPGAVTNLFTFAVTNRGESEVTITALRPSCGCTVAKLPGNPWKLAPGAGGQTEVVINLAGKHGLVTKQIFVDTSHGPQVLTIKVDVPVAQNQSRDRNMQMALADRQAVFRGDCASCHVTPAIGKTGQPLYVAACGICHDSDHRATMVPDLKNLKKPTDAAYWTKWISEGKTNSLMPAFALAHGGPLNDSQIKSLVDFLTVHGPVATAPRASVTE